MTFGQDSPHSRRYFSKYDWRERSSNGVFSRLRAIEAISEDCGQRKQKSVVLEFTHELLRRACIYRKTMTKTKTVHQMRASLGDII